MSVTASITEDDFMTVLGDFIALILDPAVVIMRGQGNRIPPPSSPNYVIMTPLGRYRLATNDDSWDFADLDPHAIDVSVPMREAVQIDTFGPGAAENATIIATLIRDPYGADFFAASAIDASPLYAEDAVTQDPFIDGEKQYEDRWTVNASFQLNLTLSTPMEFANTLAAGLIDVDVEFPAR